MEAHRRGSSGPGLQSDELLVRLLPDQPQTYVSAAPTVQVPFAHIAGIPVQIKRAQSWRKLMATQLAALLNRPVLVAIPVVFADAEARRCRLVAAEQSGLWLVSAELADAVQPRAERAETQAPPAIFVPFAQIAAVVPVAPEAAATVELKAAVAAGSTPGPGPTLPAAAAPAAVAAAPKRSSTTTSKPPQ